MSPFIRRAAIAVALLAAGGCADRSIPVAPHSDGVIAGSQTAAITEASGEQLRHERLARRFALGLAHPGFRAQVFQALRQSKIREGKIHLQRFLHEGPGRLHQLAELASESDSAVNADLDGSLPIELYLPVPAHRHGWRGDTNVLVATAEADHDTPVAFDTRGRRQLLDPVTPPAVPVIALERAEVSFESGPSLAEAYDTDPDKESTAGSGGLGNGSAPGLWMTYAHINSTFEGWLKGSPEFEIHILGQDGNSGAMKSYQCAGESAGTPYEYNQDDVDWSGNVMLFSQGQLDAYKAEHPGQALRILVMEDDDTRCVIKTDSARVKRLFEQIAANYGSLTGGKDTLVSVKTFKKASTLINLFKMLWSVIQSQDDIVGTAIEDSVAGEYFPGANWIIKGENTATQGALRLEMR